MKACLVTVETPKSTLPVTAERDLSQCFVCNLPLSEQIRIRLQTCGFDCSAGDKRELTFCQRSDAWISEAVLALVLEQKESAHLFSNDGQMLGWIQADSEEPDSELVLTADNASFAIRFPWDLLRINEELVGAVQEDVVKGDIGKNVTIDGHVIVGEDTRILAGVYIEGNVVIGRRCKIGPNCYIRGNTSIGDDCHLGQAVEVKNSLIMNNVGIGHLSYCGDSIIGNDTNFGAGTITANFRHDGKPHKSMVDGVLVDTGRRKFGAIIGDDVHTGIHTSIYPGRKIWPHMSTRPGTIVQHDLNA